MRLCMLGWWASSICTAAARSRQCGVLDISDTYWGRLLRAGVGSPAVAAPDLPLGHTLFHRGQWCICVRLSLVAHRVVETRRVATDTNTVLFALARIEQVLKGQGRVGGTVPLGRALASFSTFQAVFLRRGGRFRAGATAAARVASCAEALLPARGTLRRRPPALFYNKKRTLGSILVLA